MTKSDDKKLAALARKNAAKAAKPKSARRPKYDPTLLPDAEDDPERRRFFAEMKKREF